MIGSQNRPSNCKGNNSAPYLTILYNDSSCCSILPVIGRKLDAQSRPQRKSAPRGSLAGLRKSVIGHQNQGSGGSKSAAAGEMGDSPGARRGLLDAEEAD